MRNALAIVLLGLAAAAPASADWLVMKNGSRLETKGAWKASGKLLIFTTTGGSLASLRAEEVDFTATAAANAPKPEVAAAASAEPVKRPPVMVITDADVRHEGDEEIAAEAKPAGDAAATDAGSVIVTAWQQVALDEDAGVEIFGGLRNATRETATNISVTVSLTDDQGKALVSGEATVNTSALPVDGTTNFRVRFPGVTEFTKAVFDVRSRPLRNAPPAGQEAPH
jgi:hypothetical protein